MVDLVLRGDRVVTPDGESACEAEIARIGHNRYN